MAAILPRGCCRLQTALRKPCPYLQKSELPERITKVFETHSSHLALMGNLTSNPR